MYILDLVEADTVMPIVTQQFQLTVALFFVAPQYCLHNTAHLGSFELSHFMCTDILCHWHSSTTQQKVLINQLADVLAVTYPFRAQSTPAQSVKGMQDCG